ncbi:RNA-binding protein 25-like [Watersipora subatra]|uniref:RNA-binding protein 25-like n=1 Tax=Watersipora subatra TaxID=2589382 RepID=UPI00355B0BBB
MESGFPKLVFGEHGDGSWERFIEEMNLCIESAVGRRGYVNDKDGNRVPIMRGAVEVLQDYYGKQESMFVKGHKFLTAKQALGESDREYLQRVESLSRYAEVANNNDRVRDKGGDVGYDRRGSSRRSGGSRDNSYERYGSSDSSRERYRGRESLREMRDKSSRYRDKSMDRFEGEKYKERGETSRYDEGYRDNSKGRSVRFSGYRDEYDDVELQNLTNKSDRESEVKKDQTGQDWWTCKTKGVKSSEYVEIGNQRGTAQGIKDVQVSMGYDREHSHDEPVTAQVETSHRKLVSYWGEQGKDGRDGDEVEESLLTQPKDSGLYLKPTKTSHYVEDELECFKDLPPSTIEVLPAISQLMDIPLATCEEISAAGEESLYYLAGYCLHSLLKLKRM